ncbi:ATP-dependent helicase [Acinetobacter baumannii]|nr:ATP-dependent helicase [Acinetobacter baumannii]WOQ36316.1 ATP-dependent helicase [Acinetobacter soli]APJ17648.1 DNA helicase UvrD [Acinetobacter baumannii]MBD0207736.1 ATP-dependent helicase [Acinetobacter baumannii]MBD0230060.1 ATP-dependent helicase [Acinetobacter baumannii]MBF6954514.1 ATP-dependent helicase [Acinetobacter baumannii]
MKLTDDQIRAIQDLENNSVIMACPGSGKTTILINKMSLCCEKLKRHNGVIGLSFTRKSSAELKRKFQKKMRNSNLNFLGTIDSFLINEIIRPFLPKLWDIEIDDIEIINILSEEESIPFVQEYITREIYLSDIEGDIAFRGLFLQGKVWQKTVTPLALFVLRNSSICRRYISSRYKYLFVDEYQDTSSGHHLIFLEILKLGLKFTAVGDIDQSIYRWRDAIPENLTSLVKNYEFKEYIIDQNHRCDPSIDLYARVFLKDLDLEENDEKKIFRLHINDSGKHRYSKLDDFIQKIKDENNLEFSDFLILAANNATLKHYAMNTRHSYRIYEDDPLESMNHYIAQLCSDLIQYKFCNNYSSYSIYENYKGKLISIKLNDFKAIAKKIRCQNDTDTICEIIEEMIRKIKYKGDYENYILAARNILNDEFLLKKYKPNNKNELQIMSIHKSKGLEFKAVIHLGLEAWVFPRMTRRHGQWILQDLDGDKNLHYVAITRAEKLCYLVNMSIRVNSQFEERTAEKSEFLCIEKLNKHIVDLGVM